MNKNARKYVPDPAASCSQGSPGWTGTVVIVFLLLTVAAAGCPPPDIIPPEAAQGVMPPEIIVKTLVSKLLRGTEKESRKAERRLLEEGHLALPWLDVTLKETKNIEDADRLVEIMVSLYLKDASSERKEHRDQARDRLVEFDKQYSIIPQLLLRLEAAEKKLASTIYQVLEIREYISGRWGWPDQAWDGLSDSFTDNVEVIKRYIAFKLENLPAFDPFTMNWDEFDTKHVLTVLSDVVIGENYTDLAPFYADLLERSAARIRRVAARVIGHLRYIPAVKKLTELLSDEEEALSVRIAATEAVGRMKVKDDETIKALVALLTKGEADNRLISIECWALGEMRAQMAVIVLTQIVENPSAMLALAKIGNELAVKPLVRMLESSGDPGLRAYAAQALGYFKTAEAEEALKKAHADDRLSEMERVQMKFSLFRIDPETNKRLIQGLIMKSEYKLPAMVLALSNGIKQNVSLSKIMELIEGVPANRRAQLWDTLAGSFENIPPYYPYGLTHARSAQVEELKNWWDLNRENLYWDAQAEMWRSR